MTQAIDKHITPEECAERLERVHRRLDRRWIWLELGVILGLSIAMLGGCTRPSTTQAIDGMDRSDRIRTEIRDRQHAALKIFLYRDTLAKLEAAKTEGERAAILNEAWNDRDLCEFWLMQDERARFLNLATVGSKLYSDQGTLGLIAQNLAGQAKGPIDTVDDYLAAKAGEMVGHRLEAGATTKPGD